jgi:hypothetical protein
MTTKHTKECLDRLNELFLLARQELESAHDGAIFLGNFRGTPYRISGLTIQFNSVGQWIASKAFTGTDSATAELRKWIAQRVLEAYGLDAGLFDADQDIRAERDRLAREVVELRAEIARSDARHGTLRGKIFNALDTDA